MIDALTSSQSLALAELQALARSTALRPTFLLTGPSGAGKSTVARRLAINEQGWYWNFVLDGLAELFAVQNPVHLQVSYLYRLILERVVTSPTNLVVLDGLEAALTGLLPSRRQEIFGLLRLLQTQTTGRRLFVVLPSQAGSVFLTPSELTSLWTDPEKVVQLQRSDHETLA